jgi:hypothetical protein
MSTPRRIIAICTLSLALSAGTPGADPAADLRPPRVKPTAVQAIDIRPWEMSSQSPFGGFRMGGSDRRQFVFSPDGKLLASEDPGGWQVQLWDVATGKVLRKFGRIHDPVALAFTPDGKHLVTADNDYRSHRVRLWDVAAGKLLRELDEEVNIVPFKAVAVSPDGRTVALVGQGRRQEGPEVHLWELSSGDELRHFAGPAAGGARAARGRDSEVSCLAYTPDGRSLALVADNIVYLWEVATGSQRCRLAVLPSQLDSGSDERHNALAFSPDGRTLAVACVDGSIRLWDIISGRELVPLVGHQRGVRTLWWAPDGKTLASLGWDNKVLTWPLTDAVQKWQPPVVELTDKSLAALWEDLSAADPLSIYGATQVLAANPRQGMPFLQERLKPVPPVDSARIVKLIQDLQNEEFSVRKRAAIQIRKLGELAVPALRQASENNSDEMTRKWLEKMEAQPTSPERIRHLRTLHVLELTGTPQARQALQAVAKGAAESPLTQAAQAAIDRLGEPAPAVEQKPDALWKVLAKTDARQAFSAVRALADTPRTAVPLLREKLKMVAALEGFDDDPQSIARLIDQLDDKDFKLREGATRDLKKLGKRAEPALRKALDAKPGVEVQQRIEKLLGELTQPNLSVERLQAGRALETLELIGGAEARRTLQALAADARNPWLRTEIKGALARLGK